MRLATAAIAAALLFGASHAHACGHMAQKPAEQTTAETAPIILPQPAGS